MVAMKASVVLAVSTMALAASAESGSEAAALSYSGHYEPCRKPEYGNKQWKDESGNVYGWDSEYNTPCTVQYKNDWDRSKDWNKGGDWDKKKDWNKGGDWDKKKDWNKGGDWDKKKDWNKGGDWDKKDWNKGGDWDKKKDWNKGGDWDKKNDWNKGGNWDKKNDWNKGGNWDKKNDWNKGGNWDKNNDWKKGGDWDKNNDWNKGGNWDKNNDWNKGGDWNNDYGRKHTLPYKSSFYSEPAAAEYMAASYSEKPYPPKEPDYTKFGYSCSSDPYYFRSTGSPTLKQCAAIACAPGTSYKYQSRAIYQCYALEKQAKATNGGYLPYGW